MSLVTGQGPEGTGTCQGDSGSSLQYHNSEEQRFSIFSIVLLLIWLFDEVCVLWLLVLSLLLLWLLFVDFCWFICIVWVLLMVICLLLVVVVVVDLFSLPISNWHQPRWIQFGIVSFGASTGCGTGHPNGYLWTFLFVIFIFILYLSWFWLVVLKPAFKRFCCSGIRGLPSTLTSSEILWEPRTTSTKNKTKLYWFIFTCPADFLLRLHELRLK